MDVKWSICVKLRDTSPNCRTVHHFCMSSAHVCLFHYRSDTPHVRYIPHLEMCDVKKLLDNEITLLLYRDITLCIQVQTIYTEQFESWHDANLYQKQIVHNLPFLLFSVVAGLTRGQSVTCLVICGPNTTFSCGLLLTCICLSQILPHLWFCGALNTAVVSVSLKARTHALRLVRTSSPDIRVVCTGL